MKSFTSYCRVVPSERTSNNKKKPGGNRKNGNRYLSLAFSQAAFAARCHYEKPRAFFNRKLAKTNTMIAHKALAHKLARAAYYIMRNNVTFDFDKCFA